LSTINDTWTSLQLNLGPFGESLVCNNLSNDLFKNVLGYTSILPYIFMMKCLLKQKNNFTFIINKTL